MLNYEKIFIKISNLKTIRGYYKNNSLNLSIESGDILYIHGSNGIGKTTLLKTLSGIIDISEGDIEIKSNNILLSNDFIINNSFYMGDYSLKFERIKVYDFLKSWVDYINCDNLYFEKLINEFNIVNILDSYCNELSQGEEKKVYFILNFLFDKKIMIFDEPFNGVDIKTKKMILEKINKYSNNGYIIIYTSHEEIDIYNKKLEINND